MSYSSTILAETGLVSYWRLNELSGATAADSKGTNTGTYANVTLGADSLVADADTSGLFNGSSSKIAAGDVLDFTGTNPFTLEAWIQPTIVDGISRRVFSKRITDGSGIQGYELFVNTSGVFLQRFLNGTSDVCSATAPVGGLTYHIAATYDGANLSLYLNGALAAGPTAGSKALVDNAGIFTIGQFSGGGNVFAGWLDELAVYNVALSADRIAYHYTAGLGLTGAPTVVPNRPAIRLQTITPAGQGYDLTDQAEALSWSSTNPGGDERCTFNLKRKWFAGAPEIAQGNTLRVTDRLDVLWQGRIEENDRAVQDSELIGVTGYGMGIALKDTESFRDVIVDQDMSAWGGMTLNEQARLSAANVDIASISWSSDPAQGLAVALPNQALGAQVDAQAWYIAPPGVLMAKAYYNGATASIPVGWTTPRIAFNATDSNPGAQNLTFDSTLRTITATSAGRYVIFELASAGVAATPAAGAIQRLTKLAVYSNHGLTLTDPGDGNPFGVLASNVVPYIVGKATGITARRIDATTFVIPQLAWRDGVSLEQAITDATQFDSVDWGTWGPCSALDMSTGGYFDMTAKDPSTQHWFILRSDCDDVALNVEMGTLYNQVDVVYQDASGQQQVATRTASVPVLSALGVTRQALLNGGTLTTAGANQLGDAFLALSAQQPPARGQVTISAPLTHYRRGKLPPHYMRANGSNLRVPDVLPSSDLFSLSAAPDRRTTFPVKRVSVDASGAVPHVTVEVDQSNDTLARLTARLQTEVAVAIGQGS